VSLNLLSKDPGRGPGNPAEVFEHAAVFRTTRSRWQTEMLQAMKERNDESRLSRRASRGFLAFGETFWPIIIRRLTPWLAWARGLEKFHHNGSSRQPSSWRPAAILNRDQLVPKLEALFATGRSKGEAPPPIPTNAAFAATGVYVVDKDVNQGRVAMMLPGIKRRQPGTISPSSSERHFGGGGFTSRIMNRVRSDEAWLTTPFKISRVESLSR